MKRHVLWISATIAALSPAPEIGAAQIPAWEREQLPLTFATASSEVRAQLAADWKRLEADRVEWKYCIPEWRVGTTRDGDTVFVASKAVLQRTPSSTATSIGKAPDCIDHRGRYLPTAHTHLTGDCSPSRGDLTEAFSRRPEFDLVICGPGITAGYVWANFGGRPGR